MAELTPFEMGRAKAREMIEAGAIPPLSEDQIALLRAMGCPWPKRTAKAAS